MRVILILKLENRFQILEGVIDANFILFLASIFCILFYLSTWYFDCYKKGYKVDFWHYAIFLPQILTIHFMYPFAGSILNDLTVGGRMQYISDYVDIAYFYCLIGYFTTYVGYFVAKNNFSKHKIITKYLMWINDWGSRKIENAVGNKFILRLMAAFLLICTLLLFLFALSKFGMAYNYRDLLLADQNMTTLFNTWNSIFSTLGVFIIVGFFQRKDFFLMVVLLSVVFLAFFTGSRGTIFFTLFGGVIIYLIALKTRLNFKYLSLAILLSFLVMSFMGSLRSSREYENTNEFFLFALLFGNNFSDLRDFAWILTYWDNTYLLGKTYLAALISFIPSSISEFRQSYSFAAYTNNFLGFDSRLHPGLRPVIFGESFLNFGVIGIAFIGFIGGYITKFVDLQIKESLKEYPDDYVKAYSKTFIHIVIIRFYLTGGFWLLYFYIFLLFLFNIIKSSFTRKV